ncbi:hypothetical protein [Phnomibacter ginsenosidimutans]|uniref:hypothetical protein n=1 Tax=Phnomibacter ginsenosidimutans TaxID=2676868 RepID=UPI0018D21C9C|nr:hypothetical protein [Phnomibacter ginsenosidimutans]
MRLSATAQTLQLSWLFTQQHRFTEPFFDDSIAVCKRLFAENKATNKPLTGIEVLLQPTPMPAAKTSVIVHHVSRCGSTLIAQLMALNEQMIVLSEVPVLDDVLQLLPEQEKPVYFNAALQWLSQCRIGTEQQVLVKADAWQLFQHEHIKRVAPLLHTCCCTAIPTKYGNRIKKAAACTWYRACCQQMHCQHLHMIYRPAIWMVTVLMYSNIISGPCTNWPQRIRNIYC